MDESSVSRLIGAIVVVYYPDLLLLDNLLLRLQHCAHIVIVKNDPVSINSEFWSATKEKYSEFTVLQMHKNLGVAGALNRAFDVLSALEIPYAWTFDQDSSPAEDAGVKLLSQFRCLKQSEFRCAAVVPKVFDSRTQVPLPFIVESSEKKLQLVIPVGGMPVCCAITSGMLIDMAALRNIGYMDESLFIDHVDTEWCFRARSKGYGIYLVHEAHMGHELGDVLNIRFLGLRLSIRIRSALRAYYIFRNGWLLGGLSYSPAGWRNYFARCAFRMSLIAMIFGPNRLGQAQAIIRAYFDYQKIGIRAQS